MPDKQYRRIAILSDIHGNVHAMQAVLHDLQQRAIQTILNLGDTLYGPIAPRATYDLLMQLDIISIRGNQDRQIYEAAPAEKAANPTMAFVHDDLGEAPLAWMQSLPFDLYLTDDIYLCHGSPSDDGIYLLEDVATGFPRMRDEATMLPMLNGITASLILCGHTHIPRVVQLASGQLIVNPGSVGLPAYTDDMPVPHAMETYSPHASYAIVEQTEHGWQVELVRVTYDVQKAVRDAKAHGREDWAYSLGTGRG